MAKKLIQWALKDLIEIIEGKVKNKFDCIIFIEGKRGLGKSTLAYKILSKLDIPIPFRPKRDIVYSREDTLKALANKKGGAIFSDEMINVAYNRDFYNEEQKTLMKALNMYRDSCNVFIGCIPSFIELDKQIQRLCQIRISVVRRGFALIHTQKATMFQSDSWDIKNNQKIESQWASKGIGMPRFSRLTTIRGVLPFGDLTENQREIYEQIKAEKRNQVFQQYKEGEEFGTNNPFYVRVLKQLLDGKLNKDSFNAICEIEGKLAHSVRNAINKHLKDTGETRRFTDLIRTEEQAKAKAKRDALGFVIESKANQPLDVVPDEVSPTTNSIKPQDSEESEQDDVFGFVQ
jgi:hypothetical protein